jgi:hypothetical protein
VEPGTRLAFDDSAFTLQAQENRATLSKRQKVTPYFLPVYIAKKGKRSSPFFGVKARKTHGRMGSEWLLHGLKRKIFLISNPRQTGIK